MPSSARTAGSTSLARSTSRSRSPALSACARAEDAADAGIPDAAAMRIPINWSTGSPGASARAHASSGSLERRGVLFSEGGDQRARVGGLLESLFVCLRVLRIHVVEARGAPVAHDARSNGLEI